MCEDFSISNEAFPWQFNRDNGLQPPLTRHALHPFINALSKSHGVYMNWILRCCVCCSASVTEILLHCVVRDVVYSLCYLHFQVSPITNPSCEAYFKATFTNCKLKFARSSFNKNWLVYQPFLLLIIILIFSWLYYDDTFGRSDSISFRLSIEINSKCMKPHPRRPRGSQSGREKRRHESFHVRAKDPLKTDSHRTISKNSSRCRLLIGHKKMLCIIVPNRRTVSPEFFSWVRTRLLLCCHLPGSFTKLVRARETFIFYFPNQKRRNYRWVEKTFGMLSAGAIQFAPRIFCFWLITIYRK